MVTCNGPRMPETATDVKYQRKLLVRVKQLWPRHAHFRVSGQRDRVGQSVTMHVIREDRRQRKKLESWKEIAGFFQRDERTVKRWEKERGFPSIACRKIPAPAFSLIPTS